MTGRRRRGDRADDRGVVATYVAIMAGPMLLVTGLVVDGGGKIGTYTEASNLASGAARAGAQAVDEGELYATGDVVVDEDLAEELAADYLLAAADDVADYTIDAEGNTVTVSVTLVHEAKMLPVGPQDITAEATATALRGVVAGS